MSGAWKREDPSPVSAVPAGIIATFQLLEKFGALTGDVIVYDVLGDVVCGGFAMPMREGYAQEIYLVTSGEMMSLYAANNICRAIQRLSSRARSKCRLAGIICNAKDQPRRRGARDRVFTAGEQLAYPVHPPRSDSYRLAEVNRQTVIEYSPDPAQAEHYRSLARHVMENTRSCRSPAPSKSMNSNPLSANSSRLGIVP